MTAIYILAILSTIAAVVCIYIFIMPRSKDGHFSNRFLQFLHDLFHFKRLLLEQIVKFLYVLTTAFLICGGFFFMFAGGGSFLAGLATMIVGPIVARIIYEGLIMGILLVQNVIDINRKLKWPEKPAKKPAAAPVDYVPAAPQWQPIPENETIDPQ